MFNKVLNLNELRLDKLYLFTNDFEIYEDEYDYLESLHTEDYSGIKDNIENLENQMLEENTEWLTGEEIIGRLRK